MTVNIRNDEMVELLKADFQEKHANTFHWESAVSNVLALPALRAFWPMSSVSYNALTRARDISGGVNFYLSDNNTVTFGYDNTNPPTLPAYAHFTAAANQSLTLPDGGAATYTDITGLEAYIIAGVRGLTFGCWCYFDGVAGITPEPLLTKWLTTGNQRSYRLERTAAGIASMSVSVNGIAVTTVNSTATIGATTWTYVVGRFIPGAQMDIWINDSYDSLAVGVPASIFDSTAAFYAATDANVTNFFDGRMSLAWICASALADAHIWGLFQRTRAAFGV